MTSVTFVEDDMRYLDPYQGQKSFMSPVPAEMWDWTAEIKNLKDNKILRGSQVTEAIINSTSTLFYLKNWQQNSVECGTHLDWQTIVWIHRMKEQEVTEIDLGYSFRTLIDTPKIIWVVLGKKLDF